MPERLRVLVADDHPINRRVFRAIFEPLGCEVDVVQDGEQAILMAALAGFDLVCLDRHMPGLSGDDVVECLPEDQCVVAWSTDLVDLPARFNGVLAKPLTAASAVEVLSLARAWRRETVARPLPPAYVRSA